MVRSAVTCLDSGKQLVGPLNKNWAEKVNALKVPECVGKQPVGPSARGSRTQGLAILSLHDSEADASLHAGKKMDFELLWSWKELEKIKGEVD